MKSDIFHRDTLHSIMYKQKFSKVKEVTWCTLRHPISGRGRAALLVFVNHAVARGDGEEHL